jgi:hypothetical protein
VLIDTTEDIIYRGFTLNDADIKDNVVPGSGIGSGISGCVIDSIDVSDVDVVQFIEKRSEGDGMDAGPPFHGARRIRLAGTLYGLTRALLSDGLNDLRAVMNARLAYFDEPADQGFQPFYFAIPTNRVEDYQDGAIELRMLAMPRAFQEVVQKDNQGGDDGDALAIPWQATMLCKDPSIMAQEPQETPFTATTSGDFTHRGNYPAPLQIILACGSAGGTVTVTAGGSIFTITVPASTGDRIVRFKGADRVITVEEDDVESLAYSYLAFTGDNTWPLVMPGATPYSITVSGSITLAVGTMAWFWEQYA